jgi:hypothetical protein
MFTRSRVKEDRKRLEEEEEKREKQRFERMVEHYTRDQQREREKQRLREEKRRADKERLEAARLKLCNLYEDLYSSFMEVEDSQLLNKDDPDLEMFRVYIALLNFCKDVCKIDKHLELETL